VTCVIDHTAPDAIPVFLCRACRPEPVTKPAAKRRNHPFADAFPLLEGPALRELADDVKAHGLLEPIVELDGMILDGRNRYVACQIAGVEPRFVPFDGTVGRDPLEFVISRNLSSDRESARHDRGDTGQHASSPAR
jgi:hypothetical protein